MRQPPHTRSYSLTRRLGSLAALTLTVSLTVSLAAGSAAAEELNHPREYARCMELAKSDPKDAFEMATAWKQLGGGDAAEHCTAVALLYGGHPKVAAERLEILGQNIVAESDFKGRLLAQAGQAWLVAGEPARAEAALTSAVGLLRSRPEVMIDRAEARAALGDYQGAVDDLNIAIGADPTNGDAFKFRASAYRFLDNLPDARADMDKALLLSPTDPAAFLESGIIWRLSGNQARAREDWLKAIELDPEGEAGDLARANIEKMDVKVE